MQHRPDFSEHLPATTSTKLCGRSREKRQFYQKSRLRTNGNLSLIWSRLLLRLFLLLQSCGMVGSGFKKSGRALRNLLIYSAYSQSI